MYCSICRSTAATSEHLAEISRILKPGGLLFLRTNAQSVPRTRMTTSFSFTATKPPSCAANSTAAGFVSNGMSRVNAVLGLAEIPREWRALRATGRAYHGVLADAPIRTTLADRWKRWWLRAEGRLALRGWPLPFGRTHLAVCRADAGRVTSASSEPARPDQGARPS